MKRSSFIRSSNTPCHCHHHCRRRRRRRRRRRGRRHSADVKTIKERFPNKMSDQAASNVTR